MNMMPKCNLKSVTRTIMFVDASKSTRKSIHSMTLQISSGLHIGFLFAGVSR